MHTDNAVVSIQDDMFNRSEFSLRIAELIKNRQDKESIVFGINGAWGEGKTTVLNFISESLAKEYPRIVAIKFNPWRFSEESKLLEAFFTTISKELSRSLSSEEKKTGMKTQELKNDLKKIADTLSEYGDAISEIPHPITNIFGKVVSKAFKSFSTTELEEKKSQLSLLISKYQRKLVVIIDDIDRLSKDEVYSIFRLVKLNGDFDHFIYLLSYDEEMVSSAIGHRFGDGDKASGKSFIEKIVQIPVKLPELTFQDLNRFFIKTFQKIIFDNKLVLEESNMKRLEQVFASTLIYNLDSPRKVIRYTNALQFSMPLMYGEVNFADLVLFEGIKIFYPRHYEFVRDNSEYFLSNPSASTSEYKKSFEGLYEKIKEAGSEKQRRIIKELLNELFPTVEGLWGNKYYPDDSYLRWTIDKRIVSRAYFLRYLTFSLGKSDVSDRAFDELLKRLRNSDPNAISQSLREFIKQYDVGNVIQKLRFIETGFSETESLNIAKGIALIGGDLPRYEGFMARSTSPSGQAALLIVRLLWNLKDTQQKLTTSIELMDRANPLEFAYEINNWIKVANEPEELLSEESLFDLGKILKERAIKESGDRPFYTQFPNHTDHIILIWSKQDRDGLIKYLTAHGQNNLNNCIEFLKAIVGKGYLLGSEKSQINDFKKDILDFMVNTTGTEWLYDCLIMLRKDNVHLSDVILETKWNANQSEENLLKQFLYWHNSKITSKS